jgi:outer membrane protein
MSEEMDNTVTPSIAPEVKKDRKPLITLIIGSLALLIAIAALVFVFTGSPCCKTTKPTTANTGDIRIAWVNTDTILSQYDFVTDVTAELEVYNKNLEDKYTSSAQALQNEYNAYIKKASEYQMTLEQQKKKEEELGQKQQALQQLEAELSQLAMNEKAARNMEVHDSIVNFISRFNKDKNYTYILERSLGSGILWADTTLEITNEVLKGLNEEYKAIKKEKEKAEPKSE